MRGRFWQFFLLIFIGVAGAFGLVAFLNGRYARATARTDTPEAAPVVHPNVAPEANPQESHAPSSTGIAANTETTPPVELPPIAPPIQGLTARDLHDSFDDIHSGHKHEAIDIMEPVGTPIQAVVDGSVKKLFLSKAGGNTIYQFDEDEKYCYYYAHLDRYADGLQEGTRVHRGDVIGTVGFTGDADPNTPHLHFTIFDLGPEKKWWRGTAINPYPFLVRAVAAGAP